MDIRPAITDPISDTDQCIAELLVMRSRLLSIGEWARGFGHEHRGFILAYLQQAVDAIGSAKRAIETS